eukprot:m.78409 g.78409  ORF g.78409 m.78409 type:complete len:530 (+) comp9218_c0_seq1:231-1820(+)
MDDQRERLLDDDSVGEPTFQDIDATVAGGGAYGNGKGTAGSSEEDARARRAGLWRVFLFSTIATLNNIAFGYDVGAVSGLLKDMVHTLDLSTIETEAGTSGLNFVAGFGALLVSGNVLDVVGRRWTIMISSMLLLAGGAVVAFAQDFPMLMAGRALQGLGSGCSWAACSVYITEMAPTEYRGALVTLADLSINLGILIGYCVEYACRTSLDDDRELSWRLAMALSLSFPFLYCISFPFLPETPRYLVMKGRDKDALVVIRQTGGVSEVEGRKLLGQLKAAHEARAHAELSWTQALCPPAHLRSTVAIAIALGLAQQLTGTEAILYYTPTIFEELSDLHQFLANLSVGFSKFVGELFAAYLAECAGRRHLMIWGNFLLVVAIVGISLSFMYGASVVVAVACLAMVMFTFSIGAGPFTFVVVNEMLPLPYRGKIVAMSVFFNRLGSGTVALTFLTLKESVGVSNAFFLYAGIGLAATLFYIAALPDLRGLSLEEGEGGHGQDLGAIDNDTYETKNNSEDGKSDDGVCCTSL